MGEGCWLKEGETTSRLSTKSRSILEELAVAPGYEKLVGHRGAQKRKQKEHHEPAQEAETRATWTGYSSEGWQPGTHRRRIQERIMEIFEHQEDIALFVFLWLMRSHERVSDEEKEIIS